MSGQNVSLPIQDSLSGVQDIMDEQLNMPDPSSDVPIKRENITKLLPFWRERFIEIALVLSMALYYVVGNPNIKVDFIKTVAHVDPRYSLPFLCIFALLCWYRLPYAVALLPFALPYYWIQKTVAYNYKFSLVEVAFAVCFVVAIVQLVLKRDKWCYWLSWSALRDRLGPFAIPLLVFFAVAAISIVVAYARVTALRAFREEVFDPLLYLILALMCLRTRGDVTRLFLALLGSSLVIALLGIFQYVFFKLPVEADGISRIYTVYGSPNSIGLFFDYTLPIGFALLMARVSGKVRLAALLLTLPLLFVLYLTQSRGAWIGIAASLIFVIALSLRNRKVLLIGGLIAAISFSAILLTYHTQLLDLVVEGHTNQHGYSTVTKRLYLWRSALNMIHDSPWLGYGLDNWLCYYSVNRICDAHGQHYWITQDPPGSGKSTGLSDEPKLSHPHNIFLHVWVSMGVFGLLAFVVILILFYWLFTRTLIYLNKHYARDDIEGEQIRWMVVGVGAAMLAAIIQGQGDSSFLQQDLAFCFWMLVLSLLILRRLAGVPWRNTLSKDVPSPTEQ